MTLRCERDGCQSAASSPAPAREGPNRVDELVFGHATERAHAAQLGRRIGRAEDRRAHHQHVGAGFDERARVLRAHAAVDFDQARWVAAIDQRAGLAHLLNRARE